MPVSFWVLASLFLSLLCSYCSFHYFCSVHIFTFTLPYIYLHRQNCTEMCGSGSCWTWGGVCVSAAGGNLFARPAPPMVVQRMDPCSDLPSFHPAVLIELISLGATHVASAALAHMVDTHLQCCHQGVADMPDLSLLAQLQVASLPAWH